MVDDCTMQKTLEGLGWEHDQQHASVKLGSSTFNIMEMGRSTYSQKGFSIINNGRPTMCGDFETWRDFTNPVVWTWSCIWTENGEPETKWQHHEKDADGNWDIKPDFKWTPRSKKENKARCLCGNASCSKWFNKRKSNKVGKKRIDKRKGAKVKLAYGWMFADEMKENWGKVLERLHNIAYANKLSKKDTHMVLYAHNMVVDYIGYCTAMDLTPHGRHPFKNLVSRDENDKRFIPRGSGMLAVNIDMTDYMSDKYQRSFIGEGFKKESDEHFPMEWRDSFALMPTALGNMASVVGLPKGATPEKFVNANHPEHGKKSAIDADDIFYAVNDTVSLTLIIAAFLRTLNTFGYQRHDLPYTVSSAGYQLVASTYAKGQKKGMPSLFTKEKPSSKSYFSNVNNRFVDTMMRRNGLLVGGMTRVFNRHLHGVGQFVAVDGRSFYPSSMVATTINHHLYGDIEVHMPNWTTLEEYDGTLDDLLASDKEGAVHVHWRRPATESIGIIPTTVESGRRKGSLDWESDEGTRWLTLFQARWAVKRGYTLTPVEVNYREVDGKRADNIDGKPQLVPKYTEFNGWAIQCDRLSQEARDLLVSPVHLAYNTRKEQRAAGNDMHQLSKLALNGGISFGKFGEMREETFISTENNFIENFDEGWDFSPVVEEVGCTYGYVSSEQKESAPNAAHIFASYITDIARCMLVSMADLIGSDNLVYCDTDSWRFRRDMVSDDIWEQVKATFGAELTEWDMEYEADYFEAAAPKSYKYRDANNGNVNMKMKGVSIKSVIQREWANLTHAQRVAHGFTGTKDEVGSFTTSFKNDFLWTLDLYDEMEFETVSGMRKSFRAETEAGIWQTVKKQMKV